MPKLSLLIKKRFGYLALNAFNDKEGSVLEQILNQLKTAICCSLLIGSAGVWADENIESYQMKCSNASTAGFDGIEVYLPFGASRAQEVEIGVGVPFGKGIGHTVKGIVYATSWITKEAMFVLERKSYIIGYNDFRELSVGSGSVDGEEVAFACQVIKPSY